MNKITNSFTFRFLNHAAVGWAVSCSAFGLFIYKPRSRRLGGFLLCLRFFNRAAVGGRGSRNAFGFFSFVCNYIQTSADDVIISQL